MEYPAVDEEAEQPANKHETVPSPTQAELPGVEPPPPLTESVKPSELAATPMETAAVPTVPDTTVPALLEHPPTDPPAPAAVETTASEVEYAVVAPAATDSEATAEDAAALSAEAPESSPPAPDTTIPVATATTAEDEPATPPGATTAAEFEPESLETTTQEDTISVEVEGEVVVAALAAVDDAGRAEPAPDEPQSTESTDSPQAEADADRKPAS